ncbi:single-stranded DNA-binding protein [Lactiplantibacillus argentoratensis]|jgi:single-strand DNA-binding protein|uniref:Single-stranded DNA-binding protein n=1 Tax=Lactiplantibacillus argentoratensis TaxID=271881 RepID=A0AAN1PYI6_9LACO|nr:single-stranded DNA-binding protein [Lactiplantibacillus argentoratensis]KTF00813.1 Single-stranded DNA-binding protein [Lactiplantibacillus plantarum]GEK62459.1 single-stranded DNA-binding protein [Lactobacillus japonicus]AYJ34269.1 single-stranded DNA-binding protein [Lactiplantibacillus argentoratensis]KRL99350.1 single-stranded dna-binding protein (ssb) (helix-destabilizing protein) [Lactiplantibacillus argentoratensis DSM 16365]KZT83219.1 Single-stranded DNA-binding protein [Lactiplant
MINRTILVGRLTRDPELRYTNGGAAVATFTIAVNRQFTNQNGEREADFISCVIWRKAAENFANFTHKGSLVGIDGRIQTRNYENQQGVRVYVTEVVVENFSLLESRAESERHQAANGGSGNNNYNNNNGYSNQGQNAAPQQSSANNNNPFGNGNTGNASSAAPSSSANNNNQADPFANNGDQIDISDDDLPF